MATPRVRPQGTWPYSLDLDGDTQMSTDVLVIGGGIAGCHAALAAAAKGVKVTVVDKGPVIRSGSGGAGVDHWHMACNSPCSRIAPDEMMTLLRYYDYGITPEWGMGHAFYITCMESYDALLDLERLGVTIRDTGDVFQGAAFRDEATKLMFAYDYSARTCLRVEGHNAKPLMFKELRRAGVTIVDRVMITSLLTESGAGGSPVVGATGFDVRTGAFRTFRAKAVLLTCGPAEGLWFFSTEPEGFGTRFNDPNCSGDGYAMAWEAGATFALMEKSIPGRGLSPYPPYGFGNAHNSWYGCSIVDANGKEVPWVDRDGRILVDVSERFLPADGQKFFLFSGDFPNAPYDIRGPRLIPDLAERISRGEYVLPLYADLPGMPPSERRAIFGLMVGNEGKSRVPIYQNYTDAGFQPDFDQLQVPVLPPEEAGFHGVWGGGPKAEKLREPGFVGGGGPVFDWDLRTSLQGLYVAGEQLLGGGSHATSAATGRYAGRKAAEWAATVDLTDLSQERVQIERERVYQPITRAGGIGWKELQAGICRVMQDYCGRYKNEETMRLGLQWLRDIRENEAAEASASSPHDLWRTHECLMRITVGEMILEASLARRASSKALDFNRLDFPTYDPPEWNKFVTTRLEAGRVHTGELPLEYWSRSPYAPDFESNYRLHCGQ